MRARAWTLGIAAVLGMGGSARAVDPRTGGLALLETADARATALGEAATTLTGDLSGVPYNPATLTTLEGAQFTSQFEAAPGDVRTGLLGAGWMGERWGVAASAVYFDAGTVEITPTAGAAESRAAQRDLVGTLAGGVSLAEGFRLGAGIKALRSELAEEFSATAVVADVGALVDLPWRGWRFGAAVQNAGSDIVYKDVGDPPPTFYRAGLSVEILSGQEQTAIGKNAPWYLKEDERRSRYWAGVDAVADPWGHVFGAVGFEWEFNRIAVFRAGGQVGGDEPGFMGGVGFWIKKWRLDYSLQFVEELKDRHRVTLSYFWTNTAEE